MPKKENNNNRLFSGIFMILILMLVRQGYSQVSADVKADTNVMLIGDQVNLTLKMQLPAGFQFSWPEIADTLVKDMPVLSHSKIDTVVSEDKKSWTLVQRIRFTCFDSGMYEIPAMSFLYRHLPDTTVNSVISEPIHILVHTMAVDTTNAIKPIKGPMRIPLSFREILPWVLAGLAVLLAVAGIIYYLYKRKKDQPVFQLRPKVKLKPEEQALMDLDNLKAKKLWQNNRIKDYHSELTEILRKYIEDRYKVMALEKTSAEILYDLKSAGNVAENALLKLSEILTLADMVKFAKAQPMPDEHERSMQLAVEFVHETTPASVAEKPQSQE